MPRPVLPQALVITLAILLVAQGSALAGIGVFTVEPSEPGCDEQMTFHVAGGWGDGCWSVTDIEFFTDAEFLGFIIYAVDGWTPETRCPAVIVDYAATEVVDPPPSGKYWGLAVENVQSLREEGDQVFVPVLACCPGNEAPVTDLRLEKINGGMTVRFTWSNVPGAENFHLYGDDEPDGPFDEQLASTVSFFTDLSLAHIPGFFLLSQSSECGESSKH